MFPKNNLSSSLPCVEIYLRRQDIDDPDSHSPGVATTLSLRFKGIWPPPVVADPPCFVNLLPFGGV